MVTKYLSYIGEVNSSSASASGILCVVAHVDRFENGQLGKLVGDDNGWDLGLCSTAADHSDSNWVK